MKRLCVCIPTYRRAKAIAEVLEAEISFLKRNGVDLRIFDSSEGRETEAVAQRYMERGFDNLFYKRYEGEIEPADRKFHMVYEEMTGAEYDYIWMIHDHTVFQEDALRYILRQLDGDADFYILKTQASRYSAVRLPELNEFLVGCAWTLNSLGAAILKRDTVLRGTDWGKIADKYLAPRGRNYSHIGYYFQRAAELPAPNIVQLEFPRECFFDFMRYQEPSWHKDTIRICLECWGYTLMALPEVYTRKREALQTRDKWFLSKYSLLQYKGKGIFGLRIFFKYEKWIRLILPEHYGMSLWIAVLPTWLSRCVYCGRLLKQIQKSRAEGRKLCLYGAGRHGFECFTYLRELGIPVDCFLVKSRQGNPARVADCEVCEAAEYLRSNRALVIITVLSSGVSEVSAYLDSLRGEGADLRYIGFEE